MLHAATEAAAGRMNLLAVTVLTSLNDEDIQEIGVSGRVSDQVLRMASLAQSTGCQGIVTSPREALMVRKPGRRLCHCHSRHPAGRRRNQ